MIQLSRVIGSALCLGVLLAAGSAQALTITSASLGSGLGCADVVCADQKYTLSSSNGGTGSLTLGGGSLSFSITLPLSSFSANGGDDNGVTSLDFSTVTYTGTASVNTVGITSNITSGLASISGTQTPNGAGTAGGFSATDSQLSGSCTDLGGTVICGIVFSTLTDFNFDVAGSTRYWSHTMNLTAVVPEPGTTLLLGMGLTGLVVVRRISTSA